eukprot:SAG22_NODE_13192_length_415_cov_0.816456_1_plen_62_part_10
MLMSAWANATTVFGGEKLSLLVFERCLRTAADTVFFTNVRCVRSPGSPARRVWLRPPCNWLN